MTYVITGIITMFISNDLIRDIISYVPREHLRELSRASPIMDREICALGIRLFFGNKDNGCIEENVNGYVDLGGPNVFVIQMESGKKYAVKKAGQNTCLILLNGCTADTYCYAYSNTRWTTNIMDILGIGWSLYYDETKKIVFGSNCYDRIFMHYDASADIRFKNARKLKVLLTDINLPQNLDMDSRISIYMHGQNEILSIHISNFKVICRNGLWIK